MRMSNYEYDEQDYEADERPHARHTQGRDPHEHREKGLDHRDVNRFAQDAFKESANALANAELGQTKKYFGVEVDAGLAAYLNTIYNMGSDFLSTKVAPKAAALTEQFGGKVGIPDSKLRTAGLLAHIGSTVALKSAGYVSPLWNSFSTQHSERKQLARKLAPVLNDIKGNHSVRALNSVSEAENEVIFSHRKRMARIASHNNVNNVIDLGFNAGSNLVLDVKSFASTLKDGRVVSASEIERQQQQKERELQHKADAGDGQSRLLASGLISTTVPQLVTRYQRSSEHKLQKTLQPYSALEMILELNEQVSSNPQARGFDEPRPFQSKNHRREQFSLEEYLMRICIQHQKDMADINPQHSEIREALREDLATAVKPLAKAIRSGDMNVMSLVRLVGEGKIIKKQGRAIANAEDVAALITKEAPKQATYVQVDPAEHYKNAAYSREQFKKRLNSYKGTERLVFASIVPDSILADAGMTTKEIKEVGDFRAKGVDGKGYDHLIAYETLGLNAKNDDQLDATLAKNEIKEVRAAAGQIGQQGIEAVHDLKASAVQEKGIESVIANVLVHKPEYLGKMLEDGRKQFAEIAANEGSSQHAAREDHRRDEAANESEYEQRANAR